MSEEIIETGEIEGGEQGTPEAPKWLTSIPEPLREHEAFKGLAKQSDVFQKYVELHEKGKASVTIPGEKATDEERAAFYAKLGRPEAPEKYSFTKPEGFPEDVPYSPELEGAYKQLAHQEGLSDKQAADIFNWYNEITLKAVEMEKANAKAELDKSVNQLKDVWKGDEFKQNLELASRSFNQIAEKAGIKDEAADFFANTKVNGLALGDHPIFLKVFSYIGKSITDDSFSSDRGGKGSGELSEEEKARQRFPKSFPPK